MQHFTAIPPSQRTYLDPSNPSATQIMIEDESGRLRLTGSLLATTHLVTGAIVAVLGTENSGGDFEVIDIRVPDLPRQPRRWEHSKENNVGNKDNGGGGKIAIVSGLGITGNSSDTLVLDLLTDYLLGYTGSSATKDESSGLPPDPSKIARLIIAGNSLGSSVSTDAAAATDDADRPKKNHVKKYGYDASTYNPSPIMQLDSFLAEILPSIPVTLMPGENDPANYSLPQQGIHRAMFPTSRAYMSDPPTGDQLPEAGWFDSVSNPWEGDVEGWRIWCSSGQNVEDVLRYLDFADADTTTSANDGDTSESRLRVLEAMLRWRCGVPTAPDTLCMIPLFFWT